MVIALSHHWSQILRDAMHLVFQDTWMSSGNFFRCFPSVLLRMYFLVNRFYLITECEDIISCGGLLNYTVPQLLSLLISINMPSVLQIQQIHWAVSSFFFLFAFCSGLLNTHFQRYCVGTPDDFSLTPFMRINAIALSAQNWASGKKVQSWRRRAEIPRNLKMEVGF